MYARRDFLVQKSLQILYLSTIMREKDWDLLELRYPTDARDLIETLFSRQAIHCIHHTVQKCTGEVRVQVLGRGGVLN